MKNFSFFFFYFFFFTFLHPTAPRNRKNYHLPFFRNSDLKCPKMPLSALKFHILQITFFPAVILRTHIPSQTDSVFPNQNAEKTRVTPFSKCKEAGIIIYLGRSSRSLESLVYQLSASSRSLESLVYQLSACGWSQVCF